MNELARFLAVTVAGVVLDIAIAYALHELAGLPLWLAAAVGFTMAASANYVVHQLWSFQDGSRRLSLARAAKYGGVALATLLTRIAVVAWLASALDGGFTLLVLIAGAGVSFFVNFTLSKFAVFAERPAKADPS